MKISSWINRVRKSGNWPGSCHDEAYILLRLQIIHVHVNCYLIGDYIEPLQMVGAGTKGSRRTKMMNINHHEV